jgi:hypothetical protein
VQVSGPVEDGDVANAARRNRLDYIAGVLAAALAVAVAATALLATRRYFLTDDFATYFVPGFREVARLIGEGRFPLLTDRIWNGGALLQEYQYAVFNPVSVLLYLALGGVNDLAIYAASFSLVHIGILAGGTYFLCRVLRCAPRHAFLAAVLMPLSDWTFFWGATDWIPGLVSMAWLVWAWGFLILTFRRPGYAPAAAGMVAMTLLAGWPFADLALLLSVLVAARVWLASQPREHLRAAAWVTLAVIAGGLLAAPAILPLGVYANYIGRPPVDGLLATDLTGLLEIGMPFVQVHWGSFNGAFQSLSEPIVYVAWFAPLVLASANWKKLARERTVWVILGSAAAFAALSMVSHAWLFRWMFRLLPYYQCAILVLVALALTRADEDGVSWNFDRLALVIAAEVWLAFSQTHTLAFVYVGVAYAFGFLAWITTRFKGRRDVRWTAFALVSSIGVFWVTIWMTMIGGHPRYPQTWTPPIRAATLAQTSAPGPTRYAIVHQLTDPADPGASFWTTYRPLNTTLEQPGYSVTGYSSLVSGPFSRLFCVEQPGTPCAALVSRVTAPVPPTNRSLIDLMSVDEAVIQHPADAAKFAAWAGAGWRETRGPAGEWSFTRIRPLGLVAWASPGAGAVVQSSSPARITAQARNDAPTQATIVLARAWYPGWSARLDGAPLVARPLAGLLVSVQLPPRSAGRLDVTFWPTGLTAGLVLAALGAILVVLTAVFPRRIDAPASRLKQVSIRFGKKPQPSSA